MTDFSGLRVGQGFDIHPWSSDPTRALVLGGVTFPEHRGLSGHSDADVVAHACTDAILGACGLGDIGMMFPDTDDVHEGADSIGLLAAACKRAGHEGWQVLNVDCTVVVDSPKIAPYREAMITNLSEAVGAPVTVKGKRTEGVEALMQAVQGFASAIVLRK